jgi:hypothetical protein
MRVGFSMIPDVDCNAWRLSGKARSNRNALPVRAFDRGGASPDMQCELRNPIQKPLGPVIGPEGHRKDGLF